MSLCTRPVIATASISFGLFVAAPGRAASLTAVDRSTWGASGVPSYVSMYIYVPDALATTPPIVVACHSCGTPVSGYFNSVQGIVSGADQNGFIIIFPEATGRNCWDAGSTASLTHDGGGDTQAVAQMVQYTLSQYGGDADRVYIMGGSSGAMMAQAMLAVYPDIFKAGSARAGVPAGCWADSYDDTNQWSGPCAGGNTTHTAQEWGDLVRAMYSGYNGPRPRVQLFHGTADGTISYNNMGEAIKEWTNVLGLSDTPTSTDSVTTSSGQASTWGSTPPIVPSRFSRPGRESTGRTPWHTRKPTFCASSVWTRQGAWIPKWKLVPMTWVPVAAGALRVPVAAGARPVERKTLAAWPSPAAWEALATTRG